MKNTLLFTALFSLLIFVSSCNNCYECTKKCGVCTKGSSVVLGCDGDASLQGVSIEAWKAYFENDGYSCTYNNDVVKNVCDTDEKNAKEADYYDCVK